MERIIDNIDFHKLEAQKYYAPPASEPEEKTRSRVNERIFSGDWWGSLKRDGAFYRFIKDENGEMELLGRSKSKTTGDYLNKYDWVPHLHSFFEELPNGTCLLGELYLPKDEQAKTTTSIMNCLVDKAIARQQKEDGKLHYHIFDVLAFDGESYLNMKAIDRFLTLDDCYEKYKNPYCEWAVYKNGKDLWSMLQEILAEGLEGVVITRDEAKYQPGKRPARDTLKIKKELQDTLDCVIIGANPPAKEYTGKDIENWPYWYDERLETTLEEGSHFIESVHGAPITPVTKPYYKKWAGSLKLGLYKNDKLVHIGNLSGITDEIKENWKEYLGKICEVGAMEIIHGDLNTLGLRHPKFLRFRDDKSPEECAYDQLEK